MFHYNSNLNNPSLAIAKETTNKQNTQNITGYFFTRMHTTHTHTPHTHTHTTHVGFYGLRGLSIGVMVLYCTNCMCYCPTPTLHLNLALTGDGAFQLSPQKNLLCMIYKRF